MSGADLRSFNYALEPVRQQRNWKFEAALARMGALQRQMTQWRGVLEAVEAECKAESVGVARIWTTRPDPATRPRLLAYLAALHGRRGQAEQEIAALQERLDEARRDCADQHRRLEVLDRDKAETTKAYAVEQFRKASAQADQEWSAREGAAPARGANR